MESNPVEVLGQLSLNFRQDPGIACIVPVGSYCPGWKLLTEALIMPRGGVRDWLSLHDRRLPRG